MRLACPNLFSWFEKEATVVTPSHLLAQVTRRQLTDHHIQYGLNAWQRTPILSVDGWLRACWTEARYKSANIPTLLSGSQEHALWQQILEREHAHLFDSASTARLASRSAALIHEWHIPSDGDSWNDHEDSAQFHRWYKLFRRECRERNWVTLADVWDLLPKWIGSGICGRELVVFAGFKRFHSALERVQQALGLFSATEEIGPKRPDRAVVSRCSDLPEEIEHAARWARITFENNSRQSICIFVPELIANRALVERTFDAVFYPAAALRLSDVSRQKADCVFHISAAAPLSEHPLISSALLLLETARSRITIANAGAILRSPFLPDAAAERSARALADVELRKKRELDVSLRELEFASRACASLQRIWPRVRRVLSNERDHFELARWSELFTDLLTALGWPGDAELSEDDQAILEQWKEALSKLSALGLVIGEVSFHSALLHLKRLLLTRGTELGDWSSPVQIIDASEAVGIEFDCVRVTGAGEETWPPQLEIQPLVPLKLQRAFHVPGSSPESARQERERMTAALFASAPSAAVTYSGRLSPFAERFTAGESHFSKWEGKLPAESYKPAQLVEVEDSIAPPYLSRETARGGTAVLKAQSQCPFRAFAEFRLNAQRPEDACFGFDARDRGAFLHKALQYVWMEVRSYSRLRSIPEHDLRDIVQEAVAQAVKDDLSSPFHALITVTERERLEELILEWLIEIERARKQSFTVETIEQERTCEISGLQLNLRIDRVDRLRNGNVLLIDYKSGEQTSKSLEGDRPREPQLLVYAASCGEKVDGVFFAQLRARKLRAIGFSRDEQFPSRTAQVKRDWDSFLAQSQDEVQRLARDFVRGDAVVDPIRGACDYCNVKPFCRVNEKIRREEEPE